MSDPRWPDPDIPNDPAQIEQLIAKEFPGGEPGILRAASDSLLHPTGEDPRLRWQRLHFALGHAKELRAVDAKAAAVPPYDPGFEPPPADPPYHYRPPKDDETPGGAAPPAGLDQRSEDNLSTFFLTPPQRYEDLWDQVLNLTFEERTARFLLLKPNLSLADEKAKEAQELVDGLRQVDPALGAKLARARYLALHDMTPSEADMVGGPVPTNPPTAPAVPPVAPPSIDSGYDAGHNFGWKARSKKPLLIGGGGVLIGLLIVIVAIASSGGSSSKTATTQAVTSAPPSEGSLTTTVTVATTIGTSQSTPSTPIGNAPLVSAAIAGVGRAGQHAGNDVWDVVTCNIRAWQGAQIKGTISGTAIGSTVSFDATTGQVDVHNTSTHPSPQAATINAQYTLVELVFAGQVSGSATCTITSVSPPPAGSTLSSDTSLWSFTSNF